VGVAAIFASPLLARVPVSALAGVIFAIAVRLFNARDFLRVLRNSRVPLSPPPLDARRLTRRSSSPRSLRFSSSTSALALPSEFFCL
jgi:hypothetical protein